MLTACYFPTERIWHMWKISFLAYCRSGGVVQIWTRRRSCATTVCLVYTVPRMLSRYYWVYSCVPYLSFQGGQATYISTALRPYTLGSAQTILYIYPKLICHLLHQERIVWTLCKNSVHTHPAPSSTPSCSSRARYSHRCIESPPFCLW
jgi:hypothetical protein